MNQSIGLDLMPSGSATTPRLGRPRGIRAAEGDLRLSQVLAGLSFGLDLAEGHAPGHAVRAALIGMRIGEFIGLNDSERAALLLALVAKDLGAPANAARFAAFFGSGDHDVKAALRSVDWGRAVETFRFAASRVGADSVWPMRIWRAVGAASKGPKGVKEVARARAILGAESAREIGLPSEVVQAVRLVDEHWDGSGFPLGLAGHAIPTFARIATLSQTMEVFWRQGGVRAALEVAEARRGRWFEPALVDALIDIKGDAGFWDSLESPDIVEHLLAHEPPARATGADAAALGRVVEVFARVIDAKSPWTLGHSEGVAKLAVEIGFEMGISGAPLTDLKHAALLHDVGKLGVSNLILDKPGALSASERAEVERHPADTVAVLARVPGLSHLAALAGAHHERLDGRGYHRRLGPDDLPLPARILAVADIAHALGTSRPYRPGLPADRLLAVMGREVGTAIDDDCYRALCTVLGRGAALSPANVPVVHVVPTLLEDYTQAA